MTEDEYQQELERLRKSDIEEHFQGNPDAGSSVKTVMFVCACVGVMFVCACVGLALLAYFGFVANH